MIHSAAAVAFVALSGAGVALFGGTFLLPVFLGQVTGEQTLQIAKLAELKVATRGD